LQRAISTERLLKTDKKTIVLEALGDGNFSLSAQGIDKPMTIMADEVFEVRANAKQLVLLRKSRDYDPSDRDAVVTVSQPPVKVEPIAAAGGALRRRTDRDSEYGRVTRHAWALTLCRPRRRGM